MIYVQTLKDYIADNHRGNQSAFARAEGVQRPQVTQWLKAEYLVVDGKLCAVRRILNKSRPARGVDA